MSLEVDWDKPDLDKPDPNDLSSPFTVPLGRPDYRRMLLDVDAIGKLPPPKSRIEGFLDQGTVHAIGGSWGSGKSFLALDWALCCATGKRWQDHEVVPGRVLYVAGEGAFGIRQRLNAWQTAWRTEVPRDDFLLLPRSPELGHLGDVDQLAGIVHEYQFEIVVIDTLARAAAGLDENSAQDMGRLVASLSRLLEATPEGMGTIIPVHHHGKGEKASMRGSSAFEAGVDGIHVASKDGMLITVEHKKAKDRPLAGKTSLSLSAIEGTGSAVLRASPHEWSGLVRSQNVGKLLTELDQHFAVRFFTQSEARKASSLSGGTFTRAWSELVTSGEIVGLGTGQGAKYQRAPTGNPDQPDQLDQT